MTSGGARTLLLVADPDWQVWEADEGNNTATVALADDGTTDLELVDGTATMPAEVAQGDRVSLDVVVHNRGTRPVLQVPVQAADEATGRELARTEVALESGETKTVSLAWVATVAEDDLRVLVRADPFDLVREEREDNNAATLHLRVLGSALPNLAITGADVRLAPDPLVEGEPATVAASVRNTGGGPASAFVVRFFVGDPDDGGTLVGESTVPGLEAGAAADASVPWPRVNVRGSLGLFVIVDADGTVRETDESDNRAFRPFRSTGLPDLVLVPADVVLEPGYPRVGESVAVRLTVRNLGERPSFETTVSLAEGKASPETAIGTLVVPPLLPGAFTTLSLEWSPAAPPGDRRLFATVDPEPRRRVGRGEQRGPTKGRRPDADLYLTEPFFSPNGDGVKDDLRHVDPEGRVVESDEGNNEVRRKVVVQNADLYLTEPYFSPNGDGVKDETTLSWRATGAVTVIVANARGEFVRTLVEDGPASGSATWDGRDASGRIAWDGRYTLTLLGEGSRVIGEVAVDLDTNRSAIHDSMPSQRVVRNLSCALPGYGIDGPQWLPGDDAVLFLFARPRPASPSASCASSSTVRIAMWSEDPWYSTVTFPSTAAVSPDGRRGPGSAGIRRAARREPRHRCASIARVGDERRGQLVAGWTLHRQGKRGHRSRRHPREHPGLGHVGLVARVRSPGARPAHSGPRRLRGRRPAAREPELRAVDHVAPGREDRDRRGRGLRERRVAAVPRRPGGADRRPDDVVERVAGTRLVAGREPVHQPVDRRHPARRRHDGRPPRLATRACRRAAPRSATGSARATPTATARGRLLGQRTRTSSRSRRPRT